MRNTFLFFIFFCLTIHSKAQNSVSFDEGKEPYFMVDTFRVDMKLLFLNPDRIESINVLKDSNAVAAYGEKAKYGAVIIKTKPNTVLLRISDIIEKYKISPADRALRVCINNTLITRPELFLAEAGEITEAEITTERNWVHAEDANSTERFINIKTSKKEKAFQ
jgi:TonB-dependent SusC/RagA subfamily outer membrane receptor